MQVAKFWRRNQLRYRLQGIVQNKANLATEAPAVSLPNKLEDKATNSSTKAKVA